jgi:hypothetical protein
MGTDQWKCKVRLDTGEFCGKPYTIMVPGKGYFCAFHHFQLTGEKLGPLCCVFDPCPNPVTHVEVVLTPKDEIEFLNGVPLNPVELQGFCDHHMDEEFASSMPKHLINMERLLKLNPGGTPPYLDGPGNAK